MPSSDDVPVREIMETCVAKHTRMAARAITRVYDRTLEPSGLKVTQFTILVALAQNSFGSITDMGDELALERSTLSRNLTRLEEKGLVRLQEDGRSRTIELTEAGCAKLEDAYPLWRTAQEAVEEAVGADNWAETRRRLRAIARANTAT